MKSDAIRCIQLMQRCCIPLALTTPMIPICTRSRPAKKGV